MTSIELKKLEEHRERVLSELGPSAPRKISMENKLYTEENRFLYNEIGYQHLKDTIDSYQLLIMDTAIPMSVASFLSYSKFDAQLFRTLAKEPPIEINLTDTDIPNETIYRERFKAIIKQLYQAFEGDIVTGSLVKSYDTNISKLVLSQDHGYKETTAVDNTLKVTPIEIVDDID